jgi:micrococcal nuclease
MPRKTQPFLPRAVARMLTSLSVGVIAFGGAALYERTKVAAVDPVMVSSLPKVRSKTPLASQSASARPMPVCGSGRRVNCVVDGDTFWLDGEKYRIANIDTPEIKGKCSAEHTTALRARQRLAEMVENRPIQIRASGKDRYGRTLVLVADASGDIGNRLVGEGLAEVWGGDFIDWCKV